MCVRNDRQSQQIQQWHQQCDSCWSEYSIDLTLDALAFVNRIDINVLRLWSLVKSIKEDMLFPICATMVPKHTLGTVNVVVRVMFAPMRFGMFKLVNREQFSCKLQPYQKLIMKVEVKLYVGGKVFTETVEAVNFRMLGRQH